MACAKGWHDWIIIFNVKATCILVRFGVWSHKPFVTWLHASWKPSSQTDGNKADNNWRNSTGKKQWLITLVKIHQILTASRSQPQKDKMGKYGQISKIKAVHNMEINIFHSCYLLNIRSQTVLTHKPGQNGCCFADILKCIWLIKRLDSNSLKFIHDGLTDNKAA